MQRFLGAGRHHPIACGALGRYDPARVRRMAESLGADVVHEASDSALASAPEPLTWRRGIVRGWAWGGQPLRPRARARSWRDAACALGSCGLVVATARRPFVHSSVSGTTPLYWIEDGEATYFASRIHTLVDATSCRLSADWEAWAAILSIYQPIGDRTPFAEVRRLRPFSRLEHDRRAGARVFEEAWPWAGVEEHSSAEVPIAEAVEAMRAVVGRLDPGEITCMLSGGRDSRLILALLRDRKDLDPRALTLPGPGGDEREVEVAAQVTEALDVPFERLDPPARGGWKRIVGRAHLCDYQFARPPWLSAAGPHLARRPGPVTDGLGLDQFVPVWRVGDPTLMSSARRTSRHLLRLYLRPKLKGMLTERLERALAASARRQLFAEAERFRGHPQEIIVSAYWMRTVRGVATVPVALLGHELEVVMPFIDHDVASALMAVPAADKVPGRASPALVDAIDPRMARIPEARDLDRPSRPVGTPWLSRADLGAKLGMVSTGPLGDYLDPAWRAGLLDGTGPAARPAWAARANALIMFSLWQRRYAAKLAPVDPAELAA